jgi:hypothetical protein
VETKLKGIHGKFPTKCKRQYKKYKVETKQKSLHATLGTGRPNSHAFLKEKASVTYIK